ncbi:hypothetical protein ACTPEM_23715, partial [Clostridioides difficile]
PFEYEQTTISATVEGEIFKAKGNKVINLGWKESYKDIEDEDDLSSKKLDCLKSKIIESKFSLTKVLFFSNLNCSGKCS